MDFCLSFHITCGHRQFMIVNHTDRGMLTFRTRIFART